MAGWYAMQVNMSDAQSNLSMLGELAWKGEEVIIAKAGKPFLRLTPYDEPNRVEDKPEEPKRRRLSGALKGQIWIAPDFDDTPRVDRPVLQRRNLSGRE